MKIFIAGGGGYIGSVLIPKLLERGYKVDVVDLFWFGDYLPKDVFRVRKDIFDLSKEDLEKYDQVIFLGGLSNDPMAEFSPSQNFIYNAAAPAYLGYVAKIAGVKRFIYAGSCSVYGYTEDELYNEESPAVSNYPYGISKLQGEQAAMQMVDKDFSVICLRQGTVSGYSPRMRLDLVVNAMFRTAIQNGVITVNNPAIWRPILSNQDAVTAYIRSIEADEKLSGIFNVASGNFTVGEIGDLVKAVITEKMNREIRLEIKHVHDYRNYKVDTQKARNVLSFKPRHDIDSIVTDLIDNYEKFKDFDNPNYYNIQVFKKLVK
ncbi:MAG TPA: SDR family oxidoreductase, partial [bacterium]